MVEMCPLDHTDYKNSYEEMSQPGYFKDDGEYFGAKCSECGITFASKRSNDKTKLLPSMNYPAYKCKGLDKSKCHWCDCRHFLCHLCYCEKHGKDSPRKAKKSNLTYKI